MNKTPKAVEYPSRLNNTAATISGPRSAPIWSIASCSPKPHPRPISVVACESMASRAGVRMALPKRSAIMSAAASSQRPASARKGGDHERCADVGHQVDLRQDEDVQRVPITAIGLRDKA